MLEAVLVRCAVSVIRRGFFYAHRLLASSNKTVADAGEPLPCRGCMALDGEAQ
jgi:hypothetical protein